MIQFGMFFLKWMVFFSSKLVLLQPFIFSLKSQAPGKYMLKRSHFWLTKTEVSSRKPRLVRWLPQATVGRFGRGGWWFILFIPYLEYHPRYRKWLGSPPFISHETAIWKVSHNPILTGLTITMVKNHLPNGMMLQVKTFHSGQIIATSRTDWALKKIAFGKGIPRLF